MARRILVVDDDMMCLKTVQRYLTEEGFEVLAALTGMQAIHIIEETKADLLLLDIEMPGLSGFAALEQIRMLPNGKQLPVIFFTGRQDRDTVKRCAAIGAEGYIGKPIERSLLLERVEEVFSKTAVFQEEKTVLLIDHDLEFLKEMKLYLKKMYKVVAVNSAKMALDYLQGHKADIAVLDYAMPELEGVDGIHKLQATEQGSELRLILVSEKEAAVIKEETKNLEIAAYLKKPINKEVLSQTLQHVL